jgi:signal transduction histidine kinase
VIGAAILAAGLLLILTGIASARIPGGATFARPGIVRSPGAGDAQTGGLFAFARRADSPTRAFVLSPIHPATWYANTAIGLGLLVGPVAFALVVSAISAGLSVLVAGVGFAFVALAIESARVVARIERRRAFFGESVRPAAHPYRPLRGGVVPVLRAEFADESRWRDVLYVAVNLPLTLIESVVVWVAWTVALALLTMPIWYDAMPGTSVPDFFGPLAGHDLPVVVFRTALGAALLPVAASLSQLVIALHRAVVAGLLCTSESRELRRQVDVLRESRSAVLDVEASELHRIERDLHDGAQQRLVALTIDLGLANERIDTDPAAAKQLILEGQEQARQALAEIRSLVRGIAPSILLDRGLVAALGSISSRGPVPVALVSDLAPGQRLPPAVERTAYFVVTEALANVAKHSGATRCEIRCRRHASDASSTADPVTDALRAQRAPEASRGGNRSRLVVEVWDDGAGGASIEPGGGLAGLASRVAAVDGTFSVSSPAGGPTLIRAEIPVAGWEPTPAYEPR